MTHAPAHMLPVYSADTFVVSHGANLGDALSFADELELDDVYTLVPGAVPLRLGLQPSESGFTVAPGSEAGREGATLHLDCALTLMSPDGQTTAAIVLVEVDGSGHVATIYLLPLVPLMPRADYALVGIDRDASLDTFAQVACARFVRGTHITLASGAQKPIEELQTGDRVLTRDAGAQDIRWIGASTTRATGAFAPIRIRAGALNNTRDLIVSPEHRLFIYQRSDQLGAGRSELLVKARHLVNGDSVTVEEGGFVDYFQLLFDTHQIIYAEGIAAESTLIDTRTRPSVPKEVAAKLTEGTKLADIEAPETLLDRPDAAELLRRASTR
ncbi:MAG: Hint domain-containing protein [Pseudomonadota bacterium]